MSHAESPVSANFRLVRGNGMEIQFTFREGVTNEQVRALFRVVDEFVGHAVEKGWTVPGARAQAAPAAPQHPPSGSSELSFQVTSLGVTIDNGKTYFKAKGGRFEKFGVVVWPEVISAAGLDVSNLPQSWAGWTAYYSVKEDGKPEKVTRLEKF